MTERRRGRAARRAREEVRRRLARELEELARLEEGGSPTRPIAIDSAAVVEVRALARPCLLCGGPLRLDAHTARVIAGVRLRVATVVCPTCAVERAIYFRLDEPPVH